MKRFRSISVAARSALLASVFATCGAAATASTPVTSDTLHQVSTIGALMEGVYDGVLPCAEIAARGTVGLGTFHRLEGEMIVLDGKVYQARVDGRVLEVDGAQTTPFAMVTPFEVDASAALGNVASFDDLKAGIQTLIDNRNLFCAVRVDGEFDKVKVRSVAGQEKPYPRLADVARDQAVFEYGPTSGTLVGFWTPPYTGTMGVAGFHLHFLSHDRTQGGHLLDCALTSGTASVDQTAHVNLMLPETRAFADAPLAPREDVKYEVHAVESDPAKAGTK